MDFLDQIEEETKIKQQTKFYTNLVGVTIAIVVTIIIVFVLHSTKNNNKKMISESISDKLAGKNSIHGILADFKGCKNKSLQVIKIRKFINDFSVKNANTSKKREELVSFIDTFSKTCYISSTAKILWMTQFLNSINKNTSNKEKDTFSKYAKDFSNIQNPLFFRAKILESIFLIYNGNLAEAKKLLRNLSANAKVPPHLYKEILSILSSL